MSNPCERLLTGALLLTATGLGSLIGCKPDTSRAPEVRHRMVAVEKDINESFGLVNGSLFPQKPSDPWDIAWERTTADILYDADTKFSKHFDFLQDKPMPDETLSGGAYEVVSILENRISRDVGAVVNVSDPSQPVDLLKGRLHSLCELDRDISGSAPSDACPASP